MTARPSPKPRPLSAIYIGPTGSTTSNTIPDLPEPPSPGGSSNGSGLPSPPATNSTGSGSTGDISTAGGSLRQKPTSLATTNMINGNHARTLHEAFSRSQGNGRIDEEELNDNDDDDDNTARLGRQSRRIASENVLALQRVKSLTQRNRMALDKLSAISRLSTPSPSRNTRSPAPPPPPPTTSTSSASTSSKSSSSGPSSQSHAHSQPHTQPIQPRRQDAIERSQSGSETERESLHTLYTAASCSSSVDDLSVVIPPSSTRPQSSLGVHRRRQVSAPTSPEKAMARAAGAFSPTLTRSPRKRPGTAGSMRSQDAFTDDHGERGTDVTRAALAAVASSRRSPTGGSGKRRGALPREFRDRRGSLDHESFGEPSSPHNRRGPPSPSAHISFSNTQTSPPRFRQNRPSVRELARRHQARWQSEDMGSSVSGERAAGEDQDGGRRQNRRAGSTENVFSGGRSLLGEGLKAAGILKKKDDDLFGNGAGGEHAGSRKRGSVDWTSGVQEEQMQRHPQARDRSRSRAGITSRDDVVGLPSDREHLDPTTPDPMSNAKTLVTRSASRPLTSTADHRREEDSRLPHTDPPTTRTYNSSHPLLERDLIRLGTGSSLGRYSVSQQPQTEQNRATTSSPFGSRRFSPGPFSSPASAHQQQSEHTRLMMEALSMFESQLARVPPMGTTTTVTIPELFRSAQGIIHASDKLNALLRASTNRALEEQIDAEVGDADGQAVDLEDVWRRVGGEYRESLRVSDELVRTMTGFLLGVGKVLRETVALASVTTGDSGHHTRSMSMDAEGLRRNSPDVGGNASGGRRSVEDRSADGHSDSRRSWEQFSRDPPRGDTLRRLSSRVDSILAAVPRPSSVLRNRATDRENEFLSPAITGNSHVSAASSIRRLFTPREQREERLNVLNSMSAGVVASDSPQILHSYEPSPTPASRQYQNPVPLLERSLPPLPSPSPIPTLPSEQSIHRPQNNDHTDKSLHDRRKASNTSILTVRPSPVAFPGLTIPNPTTAVTTHTVSNSPENTSFPLLRSNSGASTRSNVTFSKPSAVSVSALTGLQQQHSQQMHRTISASSTSSNTNYSKHGGQGPTTPLSGSETERDNRRRTIGAKPARASLDNPLYADRRGDGGSSNQPRVPPSNSSKKERRRTLTEIFSQG